MKRIMALLLLFLAPALAHSGCEEHSEMGDAHTHEEEQCPLHNPSSTNSSTVDNSVLALILIFGIMIVIKGLMR